MFNLLERSNLSSIKWKQIRLNLQEFCKCTRTSFNRQSKTPTHSLHFLSKLEFCFKSLVNNETENRCPWPYFQTTQSFNKEIKIGEIATWLKYYSKSPFKCCTRKSTTGTITAFTWAIYVSFMICLTSVSQGKQCKKTRMLQMWIICLSDQENYSKWNPSDGNISHFLINGKYKDS